MGWESSAAYYRVIDQEIRRRFRGTRLAVCHLDALAFADVEPSVKIKNQAR